MSAEKRPRLQRSFPYHPQNDETHSHHMPDEEDQELNSLLRAWEPPHLPQNDLARVLADYDSLGENPPASTRQFAGSSESIAYLWTSLRRRMPSHQKPLWGAVALLSVCAIILMKFHYHETAPLSEESSRHEYEILSDVDRLLKQEVPSALEPGLFLANQFMTRARGQ